MYENVFGKKKDLFSHFFFFSFKKKCEITPLILKYRIFLS